MKLSRSCFQDIAKKVQNNREQGRGVSADAILHMIEAFPDKETDIQLSVLAMITESAGFFEGKKTPELNQKVMEYCGISEAQLKTLTSVIQTKKTGKFEAEVEIEQDGVIRSMDGTVYRTDGSEFKDKKRVVNEEKPYMNARSIYDTYKTAKAQEQSLYSFAKDKLGTEGATAEELTGAYMALAEENDKPRNTVWEKFTGFFKSIFNNFMLKKLENKLISLGEGYTRRDNAIQKASLIAQKQEQKEKEKAPASQEVTEKETEELKNNLGNTFEKGEKTQTSEQVKESKTNEISGPTTGNM